MPSLEADGIRRRRCRQARRVDSGWFLRAAPSRRLLASAVTRWQAAGTRSIAGRVSASWLDLLRLCCVDSIAQMHDEPGFRKARCDAIPRHQRQGRAVLESTRLSVPAEWPSPRRNHACVEQSAHRRH